MVLTMFSLKNLDIFSITSRVHKMYDDNDHDYVYYGPGENDRKKLRIDSHRLMSHHHTCR